MEDALLVPKLENFIGNCNFCNC